ncbi:archease [Parasulfuritortus cantonensis]|uniref:Archease n=1 Tax=Parasulfuritortus cantonensis TaxID=2528202 RepID=A0A4R1B547_9PROT|nr:archease [Parasulfuritortus cantonensis]TCJ11587.1 archease [Parasulfuritortus cantonensis]
MFGHYHYFDHGADVGIEAVGKTQEAAFEYAASAMFAIMTHPSLVLPLRRVHVEFDEPDRELALVEWLNRLLGQAHLANLVLGSFQLRREGDHYVGEGWGMPWKKGAEGGAEVKEATRAELKVEQQGKKWHARCVVNI